MPGKILLSTAYLPPVDYFSLIADAGEICLEAHENYIKQSYRNRCYILSSQGAHLLSVPVFEGSRHKVPVRQVRIDYSKRWQQVHLRAIVSSYRCSPYFEFFYESLEKIILADNEFLWDLNMELLKALLKMLKIKKPLYISEEFAPPANDPGDFRYRPDPAKPPLFEHRRYLQVFSATHEFIPNLSIIDLIFNQGPDATEYLGERQKIKDKR